MPLTGRMKQALSDREIELWFAIERIALAAPDTEQARRDVVTELARFIDNAELESLIRRACRYE